MKKLMTVLLALHISFCGIAQNKKVEQVFDTYQHMEGVISVNVARPMFSLLNKLKINTGEKTISNLMSMLKEINSLKLLAVENGLLQEFTEALSAEKLPPEKLKQLQADINRAVADVNYMELITVNAKGRSLKFMTAQSDGTVIQNLLLSITSEKEGNLLLFLDGKINMEEVNKFIAAENE
ncbi:MAG: DUF4252 domain-containing protein [Rhizobacter sp.]|nr:DUF4252 domain-containing protein [Ferruginibacter sp.]